MKQPEGLKLENYLLKIQLSRLIVEMQINDKVSLSDFDNKTEFNRFRKKRFVNEKRLRSYPAVKICRLGVDESLKGMSIGTILLKFIKTFFVKDNKTGCRFITVDAYSNAISFYERNGFIPLNDDDKDERTRLLYFDLYDVMDEQENAIFQQKKPNLMEKTYIFIFTMKNPKDLLL